MLISIEKRFFFVANTKTASTSIEHALLPYADIYRGGTPARKHTPMSLAIRSYPFLFEQPGYETGTFFRFGVMREPIEWISSWFRYRKGNKTDAPLPADMDFAAFWKARDWNIQRVNGKPNLQSDMFCNTGGAMLVDMVIPYHELTDKFAAICRALKIPAPLPHKNVSALRESSAIPPALEAELRAHYASDYALWDKLPEINAKGMDKLVNRIAPNIPPNPARR